MHHLITDNIDEIKRLCERYDVQAMYLFGSARADDSHIDEDSDIDILVSFKNNSFEKYTDNYFELHQKLEQILGRNIDLVTENSLKNPYFIQQVNETKELLYAA